MPAFNHVTRLGTATALLMLLGSYVFSASADAAEGDISRINQGVTVDAEQQVGDVSSVNGSIRLARGAEAGEVTTVNGTIELDDGVTVNEAGTVNGGIRLGSDVKVNGELSTVNGGIRINAGSVVAHNVETVNGRVHLESAVIRQNIVTSNGDIDIVGGAIVEGDIIVEVVVAGGTACLTGIIDLQELLWMPNLQFRVTSISIAKSNWRLKTVPWLET
jgi:hypothetical protein